MSTSAEPIPLEELAIISENYEHALHHVNKSAADSANDFPQRRHVRLVAVGKAHNVPILQAAYNAGCRVFGENYVQEIAMKATSLPKDIEWHFIGHLQTNKVKELLSGVETLDTVESVDTEKLAQMLNDGVEKYRKDKKPLVVYVQVNTSGEKSKCGVEPDKVVSLSLFITKQCPHLRLGGFMTIGMPDYTSRPENFECLRKCREKAAETLEAAPDDFDLSMGMSGDYCNAILMGSSNVRVGTAIFGHRGVR